MLFCMYVCVESCNNDKPLKQLNVGVSLSLGNKTLSLIEKVGHFLNNLITTDVGACGATLPLPPLFSNWFT